MIFLTLEKKPENRKTPVKIHFLKSVLMVFKIKTDLNFLLFFNHVLVLNNL